MEKKLSTRDIAAIKRQFKNSLPVLRKIESIKEKITKLQEELTRQEAILEAGEQGIIIITGGYRSIDLVTVTYEPQFNEDGTPKMEDSGKYQLKKTILTFNYPEETTSNQVQETQEEPNNEILDESGNQEVTENVFEY